MPNFRIFLLMSVLPVFLSGCSNEFQLGSACSAMCPISVTKESAAFLANKSPKTANGIIANNEMGVKLGCWDEKGRLPLDQIERCAAAPKK